MQSVNIGISRPPNGAYKGMYALYGSHFAQRGATMTIVSSTEDWGIWYNEVQRKRDRVRIFCALAPEDMNVAREYGSDCYVANELQQIFSEELDEERPCKGFRLLVPVPQDQDEADKFFDATRMVRRAGGVVEVIPYNWQKQELGRTAVDVFCCLNNWPSTQARNLNMQGWTPDELRVVFGIKDVTETAEDVEFVKRYWAGDSEGRSQIYYGTT